MLHYAEKQVEINKTRTCFTAVVKLQDLKGKDTDLEKFITPQYYPIRTMIENLSFSSTVFRHSLRLTITILIGFIIGKALPFQNAYWILLLLLL
jgi:uncharacterized membrane protein YccC